jgi:hypothetical protein
MENIENELIITFEKYAQMLIVYFQSMTQEEWTILGIVLLVSFIIIFIAGMTNRVVIFNNGMDLFWTALIFIIPILFVTIGVLLKDNNSITEQELIYVSLGCAILSLLCILKVILSSIKHNGLILGLFISFFKILSAVIIAILSIGLIGRIFDSEKATFSQRMFALVLFGILLFVIRKLINGTEVRERREIASA